jgi:hypothetical protein
VRTVHLPPFPGADALLQDAIGIARMARSATVGWRTICVRAQRTVGRDVVQRIAGLDLDLDLPGLSNRVRDLTAAAPAAVDTLVFGIFDGISDGERAFTGYHLAGARGFDPASRWLPEPSWVPDRPALVSPSLDALARLAAEIRGGPARVAVTHPLRFGAAALLSRFAARDLPYRVVLAFEGGDCAEVGERRPVPRRNGVAPPLLTRI